MSATTQAHTLQEYLDQATPMLMEILGLPELLYADGNSYDRLAEKYPDAEVLAGVATGAIAHGVLVAEKMGKPFIYVRSAPKSHGLTNQVEGEVKPGAKVVVIEDLVSTGGSSLSAVEALKKAGCDVLGMVAIFTYGFPTAEENFAKAGVKLDTLSNYNTMIEMAIEQGYVHPDELETLKEWRRDPASWKK